MLLYSFSLKEEILRFEIVSEDEDAVFTQVDKKDSIQVDLDLPYLDKVRQAQARERNTDYSFLRRVMELG